MFSNCMGRLILCLSLLTAFAISPSESAQAQYLANTEKEIAREETPSTRKSDVFDHETHPNANGSSSQDLTVIQGVNTAGSVRVNMLANLEALLNIGANGVELISIGWAASLLAGVFFLAPQKRRSRVLFALLPLAFGLAAPGLLNGFISSMRDANLFS